MNPNYMQNLKFLKKGDRLNPYGRPKGTPNRSTIAKYVLSMATEPPEKILLELEKMYPMFFRKRGIKWSNEFLASIRLAQKAIIKADVAAYNALMDSAYGKSTLRVENPNPIEQEELSEETKALLNEFIDWRKKRT